EFDAVGRRRVSGGDEELAVREFDPLAGRRLDARLGVHSAHHTNEQKKSVAHGRSLAAPRARDNRIRRGGTRPANLSGGDGLPPLTAPGTLAHDRHRRLVRRRRRADPPQQPGPGPDYGAELPPAQYPRPPVAAGSAAATPDVRSRRRRG